MEPNDCQALTTCDDPNNKNRCHVTSLAMPTEVITKTITIEGDSSTMTHEELQAIIRRSGSDENILDDPNVTSTHVVSVSNLMLVPWEIILENQVCHLLGNT